MRLTAELIQDSLSYLNPLKERELDLRDNDIQVLGNFPLSPRIQTLLLARNRVSSIQVGLPKAIPNLKNLVLASNNIAELADLDVLAKFSRLTHLVLADNPVTKKEHYRYWVLWRCPTVRFLDYEKVKEAERERGRELFGTEEEPTALATQIMNKKTKTLESRANGSAAPSKLSRIKLTEEEKAKLQERIKNATSLQEIIALERELNEGRLPSGIQDDAMEE
ncbi:U2 small nuclear ribonucleoprotein A' [Purpureocillium lilacinum]|uniref:U2 small nuclear ribonucleoprotein A' n=1 Tax=Purpureocillium lilacinum TaxID=33203 RepID=A0A179HAW5_PURLI|nr:U2 small nuclear ribonucleoprotein A' [Purpureocillium lilacinum]